MSDNIIQLNEQVIKAELKDLVKQSVEETLNNLLDQEAAELTTLLSMSARSSARAIVPAITRGTCTPAQAMSR